MERKLFTWKNWDMWDDRVLEYLDVTLVKQIGNFPPGTHFDRALLDYEHGVLQLNIMDEAQYVILQRFDFDLALTVAGPHA